MSCIFCEIANGNIPSTTIYEDDLVRAILDVNPTVYGHTLVLPKVHAESLLECPAEVRNRVFEVAAALGRQMEKELGCDGMNVITNIREGAGQTVMHFHVHILPRYSHQPKKDALQYAHGTIADFDPAVLAEKISIAPLPDSKN